MNLLNKLEKIESIFIGLLIGFGLFIMFNGFLFLGIFQISCCFILFFLRLNRISKQIQKK